MPYGPVYKGGPSADAPMERCVAHLMKQGKSKHQAIAICKAGIAKALRKRHG